MIYLRSLLTFIYLIPVYTGLIIWATPSQGDVSTDLKTSTLTLKQLIVGKNYSTKYECLTLVENAGPFTSTRPPIIEKYRRTIHAQNNDFAKAMYLTALEKEFQRNLKGFDVVCSPVSVSANHNVKKTTKYFAPELL